MNYIQFINIFNNIHKIFCKKIIPTIQTNCIHFFIYLCSVFIFMQMVEININNNCIEKLRDNHNGNLFTQFLYFHAIKD